MEHLLRLGENYMMQRVMSHHSPLTHVNKAVLGLCALGGILAIISLGFILYGVFQWLHQNLPSYEVYMIFGSLLFALALFSFVAIGLIQSQKKKKALEFKHQVRDEILLNLKLVEAEIKDLQILENHPKTCVTLATLAGFILTEKAL